MPSTPVPTGGEPVADDPDVMRWRATLRRRGRWTLLVGLVLLTAFLVVVGLLGAASDRLRHDGGRVRGTVLMLNSDTRFSEGSADIAYEVGATRYRETVDLGDDAADYHAGQRVTVYYDQHRPQRMTIGDEDNEPVWSVVPVAAALVGGFGLTTYGTCLLVAGRRVRRIAREANWARGHLTAATMGRGVVGRFENAAGRVHLLRPTRLWTGWHRTSWWTGEWLIAAPAAGRETLLRSVEVPDAVRLARTTRSDWLRRRWSRALR